VPLASVAGEEVTGRPTGRFTPATPAPRELPGEQDAQDAEDKSGEAEGDVNGVVGGQAACGEASHSGGDRDSGNIYTPYTAVSSTAPSQRVFFEKKKKKAGFCGRRSVCI
jgi:hypothetical protein